MERETVMRKKNAREYCLLGIVILSSLIVLLFLLRQKEGMHEDEFYTYVLSNSGGVWLVHPA